MDALHVGRLRARYHVGGDEKRAKARLDRALSSVLDEKLGSVLADLGLGEHEIVCVKKVNAPAQLTLRGTDPALAEAWTAAIVAGLRDVLSAGSGVVRYRSRQHALLDLVESAAAGDLTRVWAWRQIGLLAATASEPASHAPRSELVFDALLVEPSAIAAVLAAATRSGAAFAQLIATLGANAWTVLARAALAAHGLPAALLTPPAFGKVEATLLAAAVQAAARIASRSALLAAASSAPGRGCLQDVSTRDPVARAVAILAILDLEPAALRRGAAEAEALVSILAQALQPGVSREPHEPEESKLAARDPTHGEARTRPQRSTRAGGLLFLLHLVDELAFPNTLCEGALAQRSLRWCLHALAQALLPIEPSDPAALAFAGLGPHADPPSWDEPKASDDELLALDEKAAALVTTLRLFLDAHDEPSAALLHRVCRRDAEIVADPAWIEVQLSLEQLSTEVRRAGLDLDPGWLPWLGAVVRFTYA